MNKLMKCVAVALLLVVSVVAGSMPVGAQGDGLFPPGTENSDIVDVFDYSDYYPDSNWMYFYEPTPKFGDPATSSIVRIEFDGVAPTHITTQEYRVYAPGVGYLSSLDGDFSVQAALLGPDEFGDDFAMRVEIVFTTSVPVGHLWFEAMDIEAPSVATVDMICSDC